MSVKRTIHLNMPNYARDLSELTVEEAALAVQAQAKALAPKRTGDLQGSITEKPINRYKAKVFTNLTYAIPQEFGTRFMSAQPYMRPAVDMVRSRLRVYWMRARKKARARNKR